MEVFVDTNYFLQFNDYRNVDWGEIIPDEVIDLIISRPVQEEIDKLKNDGNTRRNKRARKINSLFREIVLNDEIYNEIVGAKTIRLRFSPNYKLSEMKKDYAELDFDKPDDELIATVLTYNEREQKNALLLTHDINPILTCKNIGLKYLMIPDAWLLQPENDGKDKRINELKNELKSLKDTEPKIEVDFKFITNVNDEYDVININDICESEKEKILRSIEDKYPKKMNFNTDKESEESNTISSVEKAFGLRKKFIIPSENEIEEYTKKYDEWWKTIVEKIEKFPKRIFFNNRVIDFEMKLKNVGNVPLENLILSLELFNDVVFLRPDYEFDKKDKLILKIDEAPIAPEGHWETVSPYINDLKRMISGINDYNNLDILSNFMPEPPMSFEGPNERDVTSFYWADNKPNSEENKWVFSCKEFRHKLKDEVFNYKILLPKHQIENVIMKIVVSGKNKKEPYFEVEKLKLKYITRDIDIKSEIAI